MPNGTFNSGLSQWSNQGCDDFSHNSSSGHDDGAWAYCKSGGGSCSVESGTFTVDRVTLSYLASGCGCASGGGPGSVLLLALVAAARRRP